MTIKSLEEVRQLEFIGQGRYGTVYKYNDAIAIKIYKEYGYEIGNLQTYKLSNVKYKLLKQKQKKLKRHH